MVKVITYGTYDLLHYGHIRLLERAKALGDYLIVGVTADDFDKTRGKINVTQSLMERIENVRSTGLADEIIVEEYEGQKIDDIRRYGVDIFTVGSDWKGHFDYLSEYCKVVYLDRTQGVSSTQLRSENRAVRLGLVGDVDFIDKYRREASYVNGLEVAAVCTTNKHLKDKYKEEKLPCTEDFGKLLELSDAVYLVSNPALHEEQIRKALENGKHVLCESPLALSSELCKSLYELADKHDVKLVEAIKPAYCTAYSRLLLLVKSGAIGKVVSVEASCTSLKDRENLDDEMLSRKLNSMYDWGPTVLLPVFQILGTDYKDMSMISTYLDEEKKFDLFTKMDFLYDNAVASVKIGKGVKSEGDLVISGTKGYVYVPAPWWKTDYFEVRYEHANDNKRYFYQLDGEGIRYELVAFLKAIESKNNLSYIEKNISLKISDVMESFVEHRNMKEIHI